MSANLPWHEARVRGLAVLADGPMTIREMQRSIPTSNSTLSSAMRYLIEQGQVESIGERGRGKVARYALVK